MEFESYLFSLVPLGLVLAGIFFLRNVKSTSKDWDDWIGNPSQNWMKKIILVILLSTLVCFVGCYEGDGSCGGGSNTTSK